jgi:hypothetical protein
MTPEQHLEAFMAYVAGMLVDAERYLMTGEPDPLRDGASYRVGAMWLTDAEFTDLLRDVTAVFQPRLANAPAKDRRRRMIYTVLLPAPAVLASENKQKSAKQRSREKKPREDS